MLSVGVNIYFIVKKLEYNKQNEDARVLHHWKNMSHKEGFEFYRNKMKVDFKETYSGQKTALICFWDSLGFDFMTQRTMQIFDSLATEKGQHSFDYIFATEMEENAAKDFLKNREVEFKTFKVLGGMDDFMSGVYTERPVKWVTVSLGKGAKEKPCEDPEFRNMKVKPYYLLMNNKGKILYHNCKCWDPRGDTALLRRLDSCSAVKSLKGFDY